VIQQHLGQHGGGAPAVQSEAAEGKLHGPVAEQVQAEPCERTGAQVEPTPALGLDPLVHLPRRRVCGQIREIDDGQGQAGRPRDDLERTSLRGEVEP
jgi:hypothetical protein